MAWFIEQYDTKELGFINRSSTTRIRTKQFVESFSRRESWLL